MISELFENIKVYGRYVRLNHLDGLEYWNKIKKFLSKSEQEIGLNPLNEILGERWNIEIKFNKDLEPTKNLDEIYEYVHEKLKMYGEEGDMELKSIDKPDWEKYHFALQLIRIPKNNSLNLLRLLQVGYNLGQLAAELNAGEITYNKRFLDYYELNNLNNLNSYIKLTKKQEEEIISSTEIQDLITNLNNFILVTINQVQSGGQGGQGEQGSQGSQGNQGKMDPFYSENLEELTINNNDYRRVLYTGEEQQFVLMSINPGDDIKMEIHNDHDQFLRIEQGEGKAIINGKEYILKEDTGLIVPAGSPHQIINSGSMSLKLYSIYSPPEHPDKLVQSINPDKLVQSTNPDKLVQSTNPDKLVQSTNPDKLDDDKYKNKYLNYKKKYIQLKSIYNK
jgi:mannose-6-phosphate isomerase-like protein (cupin superfamily)